MSDDGAYPLVIKRKRPGQERPANYKETAEDLASKMQDLLQMLVPDKSQVFVNIRFEERTTVFEISCDQEVYGKILGRHGRIIDGFRHVFTSISARIGFRSIIEVPYFPERD